jgi:hypothetical protein
MVEGRILPLLQLLILPKYPVSLSQMKFDCLSNELWIVIGILVYRTYFALNTRTTFVPDEYFQGPEVAFISTYEIGKK